MRVRDQMWHRLFVTIRVTNSNIISCRIRGEGSDGREKD